MIQTPQAAQEFARVRKRGRKSKENIKFCDHFSLFAPNAYGIIPPSHEIGRSFMTPVMLRQIWSLIEGAQATTILSQDDPSLVEWLLSQLREQRSLASDEVEIISRYIQARTPLIREIAATH